MEIFRLSFTKVSLCVLCVDSFSVNDIGIDCDVNDIISNWAMFGACCFVDYFMLIQSGPEKIAQSLMHCHFATVFSGITQFSPKYAEINW